MQEAIKDARKVMKSNGLKFATIWKTNNLYGFNFDKKPIGYTDTENGVIRKVVAVICKTN